MVYCNITNCVIDIIGDAFVVVGGLPGYKSVNNHALACVQFALHMARDMAQIREVRKQLFEQSYVRN